ncbi:MAG: glutathione S-transferase family protein [Gammaproteobacteria bacterium]|nr:glutathione S-transferase family protein [Gammaproteobacteria bacterium]
MILHDLPGAPNPTKVRLYLAEKAAQGVQMDLEIRKVNVFKKANRTAEFLAKNPFGTMPVLELDDGRAIFESLAIIEYLEEKHPQCSMWGDSPEERGRARTLERVADVRVLIPSATYVHATNSPLGYEPNAVIAKHALTQLNTAFTWLDRELADGRPFLMVERVTVADCTLQGALQFMRFRELENLAEFPNINRWSADYRLREPARQVLMF